CRVEAAPCVERRTTPIVVYRQSRDEDLAHPASQRSPARAVPLCDPIGGHAAHTREVSTRVERRTATVVENEEDADVADRAAQRLPARPRPLRDVLDHLTANGQEGSGDEERWTAAVVVHRHGEDAAAHTGADGRPGRAVPRGDVVPQRRRAAHEELRTAAV